MKDIILTLVRSVLVALGGGLAAKGVIGSDDAEQIAGAVVTLVGAVWTAVAHRKALLAEPPAPVPAAR